MVKKHNFEQASKEVISFLNARGWLESNTPRGIATSISLEANELLEYFQWSDEPVGNVDDLSSELADVIIYAIQFAYKYNIDIPTVIIKKLEKQGDKYPVEIFQTKSGKDLNEAWLKAKQDYKKDTTL